MLGRDTEAELLSSLLRAAAAGRGGGVVVHGEPGIGKTALLSYATQQAAGFQVLRAVGVEPEADLAYATLHQLLLPALDWVGRLPGPQAEALDILFGRAHGAPPDPFMVGLSTLSLLSVLAGEKPVLCVLDDAHWADQPTLKTLAFVARRLDNEPIAMALAARADEGHSTDLPHLRRIPLMGLNADAAEALLDGKPLSEAERAQLLTATGGNPLALLELAGRRIPPDGTVEPLAMTEELQRSFLARIRARHAGSLPLLQLIAADGSGSVDTIEKAATALRIATDPLRHAELDDLLTHDGPRLVYRHPLIRSAIYHSATADRRAAIHRALAAAFDSPADQHRCAWHLGKAAVGHDEHAAEQLERSAEQAALRGGPAATVAALTRAAELTADGPRRARRLWNAALAAVEGGFSPVELVDRAEREPGLAETDQIALAAIRATVAEFAGSPEDAMELIEPWIPRALRLDRTLFTPTIAMYADLGLRTNRPQAWADLHEWLDESTLAPEDVVLRLLRDACAVRLGRDPGPAIADVPESDPITMTLAGSIARHLGDLELSRRLCRDAGQLARTRGSLGALAWNLEYQATDEIARGRFGVAESYAEEGRQFAGEAGQPNTACRHKGLLALCAAIRGRQEATDLAVDVLAESSDRNLADAMSYARRALGLIELVAGRHSEAARHFEAVGEWDADLPSDLAMGVVPDLVEALVRAGEHDRAAAATTRYARWAGNTALTARCRALVTADADHYAEGRHDSPFESARTELLLGEQLRRDRRRSEAQRHLRAAAENFRRIGAVAWAERAQGELRATGEAARAPEAGALSALTPQELRITLAVGEGLTNREIAGQLFLSPRTVDYHLRKVFQKASITSRAELMRLVLAERPARRVLATSLIRGRPRLPSVERHHELRSRRPAMTINAHVRKAGRFLWHYAEMAIAMALGMLLLGLLWDAVLPRDTRFDVDTLIMAADMTVGMALWMRVRRHSWPRIGEMGLAMIVPFVILLVPYWFGAVSEHVVMSVGHALMFIAMALVMLWRHEEYTHRHHKSPIRPKWIWRSAAVVVALLPAAAVSAVNTVDKFGDRYEARQDQVTVGPRTVVHDPAKPTVAFLVGSAGANVADLLGPYEVLASTGRMNTYIVSPGARLVPLTGGLDIVPDLTFDELPRVLGTDTLDAVVIPALREPERAELDSISGWLRQQSAAGALTVSVCNGARTLAASGLLDGRAATSHWLRLAGLRSDYGAVNWVSGQRYVDDGNVISTAGVVSGIDGALRILERLVDADTARAAAANVHWRHYTPGASARIPEAQLEWSDLAVTLNSSYQTGPSTIGVRIFDGTGELELASAFISYTEQSVVGRTVAVGDGVIHSKHGLTFVPRTSVIDGLDRVLVPGLAAARQGLAGPGAEYLHVTEEFAFDPVLRDIARTYDVPTARFAAKTLEYPVVDVELTGSSWPWPETVVALVLVALGAAFTVVVSRWWSKRRVERTAQPRADLPPAPEPDGHHVRMAVPGDETVDSVPQLRVPSP